MATVPAGTWIADRYRVDALLGAGAMGAVYRAHDAMLGRAVAIKVLHTNLADHPTLPRRFEREAFAAAQLDHPNCVQVFDAGWADGVGKYLVMPLLEGRTLRDLVDAGMTIDAIVDLSTQILAGLDHAHRRGFVHRDIKPDNVFVVRDGHGLDVAKVVDFGLVKIADARVQRGLTQAGTVFGTPCYMAPEQASGGRVDARADLYAVGATMYEALCGHPPFTGETFPEILRQHVLSDPEPLPDTVPPALADFVMCMLAKQPEDRPDNAAAAIEALRAAAEGVRRERPARTPTFHPAVASELGVSSPTPTPTPTPRPAPRRAASSVEVHGLAAVRFEPRDGASVAFRPPTLISRRSGGLGLLAGLGVLAAILVAWVAVSAANPASLAAVIDVPSIATMPTPTPPAVEPADDTPQAGTTLAQAEVPQVDVPEPEPPLDPTPAPTTSSPTGPSSSSPRPRGSKVPDPRWIGPKPTQMPDPIEPKPPKTADPKPKPPASDPKPDPSSRVLTTDRPPRTPTKASKLPGITESSSAPARVQRPSS